MTDRPGHYREELSAAYERIGELERELAVARGLDGSDALGRMLEQRAQLVKTLRPRQLTLGSIGLGALFGAPFGGIGIATHDWHLIVLGLVVGTVIALFMRVVVPIGNRRAIEALDAKIAEARRVRALERSVADMQAEVAKQAVSVRVDASTTSDDDPTKAADEPGAAPARSRRT